MPGVFLGVTIFQIVITNIKTFKTKYLIFSKL